MKSFKPAFNNKRVLITGHTGFKGSWLALWLASLGARLSGYALPALGRTALYRLAGVSALMEREALADIRDYRRLKGFLRSARPDFVFHLAAQALVRESYRRPRETFETNLGGSVNLLDALRELGRPCAVVFVTSDKCYANTGKTSGYRECDPLGGHDPYSASKGAAEIVASAYRASFFASSATRRHGIRLATARSGNVIGGGDWSADRIVPDCIAALRAGRPVEVRNPGAVRPWQHVLEPLAGYLLLAERLAGRDGDDYCSAWNFGPPPGAMRTVEDLVAEIIRSWGSGSWRRAALRNAPHEASLLTLSSAKARAQLCWRTKWDFKRSVGQTIAWYKAWAAGRRDLAELCREQIGEYIS